MKTIRWFVLCAIVLLTSLPAYCGNVLVILSGADHIDLKHGGKQASGFYLNELMQPVMLLMDAGHALTFATPDGRIPTLEQGSIKPSNFGGDEAAMKRALERLNQLKLLSPTDSPVISFARAEQIGVEHFDGLFVPGGTAPMQDLVADPALGRILIAFHQSKKPTALVCHGPAALLSAVPNSKDFTLAMEKGTAKPQASWIYYGYRLTAFSNRVEDEIKARGIYNGDEMKFLPQSALQVAGGIYSEAANPIDSYLVEDRELITGENPNSSLAVGKALVARLK